MQKWTGTFWRQVTPTTLCTGQNEAQNGATHHKPELGIGLKNMSSCDTLPMTWQNLSLVLWVESADHNYWHFSGQTYNLHMCQSTFFTYMLNQPHHSTSQRTSNWLRPWRNKVWKILNDCFPFTTTSLKGHDVSGPVCSQPRHNETNESRAPNRKPLNHVLAATNKPSFCRKRVQNYVQHADFVCPLLHLALSQFGPKEILGNSAKVSRPGRLIWAAISDEWLPLLGRTSQMVQECPHTDGHPSSHNHGKWIMTISYHIITSQKSIK